MADREKLIAELANEIAHICPDLVDSSCGMNCCVSCLATKLDEAGYRKDVTDNNVGGKWIPVTEQEEPTENGTYLCHGYWFGSRRKQTETADFFGEWNIANNFILTHWMPLPPAPEDVK